MAPGILHAQASTLLALAPIPAGFGAILMGADAGSLVEYVPHAFAFSTGAATGLILSPDLDQDGLTMSEWMLIKHAGVLGGIFFFVWLPYALAIKHRSKASHFPVVGTIGRVLYSLLIWNVARGVVYASWRHDIGLIPSGILLLPLAVILWWFIGLAGSDFLHWLMDGCPSKGIKPRK